MAQRMTFGLFSGSTTQRVEFVRMKGPQGMLIGSSVSIILNILLLY